MKTIYLSPRFLIILALFAYPLKCSRFLSYQSKLIRLDSSSVIQPYQHHHSSYRHRLFTMAVEGHQPNAAFQPSLSDDEKITKFRQNQQQALRPTFAEEVRTLIEYSTGYGVLSTNSVQYHGYPTGSIVGFATNDQGMPIFVFSGLSSHTKDVNSDGRVSLTVTSKDFKGAADGRAVFIGQVERVKNLEEVPKLREIYLTKHPEAYYVDFGDFSFYKMTSLEAIRFVGGFAMAGNVNVDEYHQAKSDPLAPFATPVLTHMNDDHKDAIIAIVQHYTSMACSDAKILSLDKYGMNIQAKLDIMGGSAGKVRVSFPTVVTDRKQIKEVLVEMTRASASS